MSARLQDIEVHLPNRPGALADLGQALGSSGVSLEGGGVFTRNGHAVAHYLVDDGPAALAAVTAAGLGTTVVRDVVITRLDQDKPGQLGALARMLGDAGVNVLVQYSDHAGNLVLLVSDDHTTVCRDTIVRWEQG
ncbi:hypothetical protein [Streptomyces sp. NPDC001770]